MQTISSYEPRHNVGLQPALKAFCDPVRGRDARYLFTATGWFARFVGPDWPLDLAEQVVDDVEKFHGVHPELHPVLKGTHEWQAVTHGWESDPESAGAIFECFDKPFQKMERATLWVKSARDPKGQIGASCHVEEVGEFLFHLSWRNPSIQPSGTLPQEYFDAFQESARGVLEWSRRRIQRVLDPLKERLRQLYGDRFRGLYVFGSYARPDAGIDLGENSDLDVALILSDFDNVHEERKRFSDFVYDLSLEHGLVISIIPILEVDFREGQTNFTRVISSYAIPVK